MAAFRGLAMQLWKRGISMTSLSTPCSRIFFVGCLAPVRGTQLAVVPYQTNPLTTAPSKNTAPPPATIPEAAPPAVPGRISNAVEYAVTKLDDLINYARKVK